jgi:hypothetical protein
VIVGFRPILLKNSGSELVEVLQGDRRFGIAQARGDSHLWRHPASGNLASATDLFVALHRPNTRSSPKSSPPKIRVFQQNRPEADIGSRESVRSNVVEHARGNLHEDQRRPSKEGP